MRAPSPRYLVHVLVPLFAMLLASGCGGSGDGSGESDEPVDRDAGRQLFQTSCRACHSLADAEAAGVFGPDLDALQPDAERVREQIADGGGGMPADILEGADAELVARYVAEVAGQGELPEEQSGERGRIRPKAAEG